MSAKWLRNVVAREEDMRHFRWEAAVDSVLTALQAADPNRLRIDVDDTIRRAEQIASKSEPSRLQPDETRDYRVREFRAELRNELLKLLRGEPSNQAGREALTLLENPRMRASLQRQPMS
jgi:hypothetical protein